MKVKQVYEKVICDNCHKEIEYGSEDGIVMTTPSGITQIKHVDKIRSNFDGFILAHDKLPNEVLNISEAQIVSIANKDYYRLPFSKPYFLFDKELLDFIWIFRFILFIPV